jgi:hypothetical protein
MAGSAAMSAPHLEGLCDWCFWPLNGDAAAFNQGIGHSACVNFMHEMITTGAEDADALPWPEKLIREDPVRDFVRRLGREAARIGIDRQRLVTAIERSRHAA